MTNHKRKAELVHKFRRAYKALDVAFRETCTNSQARLGVLLLKQAEKRV